MAFTPKIGVDTSGGAPAVVINAWRAVRFHAGNGNLSAAQRAEITAGRIKGLVDSGFDPGTLGARGDRLQGRVYAGETLVCIATAADAKANRSSPASLAASWAATIKALLLMPPVVLSTRELVVPLGENRRVEVGGAATGPIYTKVDKPEVATTNVGSDGRYIQVAGRQVGAAQVEVSVEGERSVLSVIVRKYAGRLPDVTLAQVTGNPCPASVVSYAAWAAVLQSAVLEPGASLTIGKVDDPGGALGPGASRQMRVEAKITGAGYLPYSTRAVVEVRNVALPRQEPRELFYSNYPERLTKYQTLFAAKIEPATPTRVLYHHQNGMKRRVHLIVEVINPDPAPAVVRISRGISSPSVDTVGVGHVAGKIFLESDHNNVSVIERIPPESRLVLVSNVLGPLETASGILQLNQMEGLRTLVRITAAQPNVDNVTKGTIAAAPKQILLKLSDHIYPSPWKKLDEGYVVGERWTFIPIGKHALSDRESQKKLHGNYGVTYDINLKVANPTSQTKTVSVLFEPSAGLASGVFIIDGRFVMAKYAQPPSEVRLASYQLKPGEVRNVNIVTVPLAGSNYPANLVVRS